MKSDRKWIEWEKQGRRDPQGKWSQPQIGGVPNNLSIHVARPLGIRLSLPKFSPPHICCLCMLPGSHMLLFSVATFSVSWASNISLIRAISEFSIMRPQVLQMVFALYSCRQWNFWERGFVVGKESKGCENLLYTTSWLTCDRLKWFN